MVLMEKSERLVLGDLPSLKAIMDMHKGAAPIQASASLTLNNEKIETAAFDLIVNQVALPIPCLRVLLI